MIEIKKFSEAIAKKDIEKWEREAQHLSKNILRIKSFEDFMMVKKSYHEWSRDFEGFVYNRIINFQEDYPHLRSKVWSYLMFIQNELFEVQYLKKHGYALEREYGRDHNRYPEEEKNTILLSWKETSKSIYQKYNRLKKEAFKAIYEFIGEASIDKAKEENFRVGHVQVKMIYNEAESKFETRKKALSEIKEAISLIQSNRYINKVLKGSELIYDEVDSIDNRMDNTLVGGYYIEKDDLIVLRPIGGLQTVIHEYGHRYFKRLLPEAYQRLWTDRLENNYVEITQEIFKSIKEAFWKAFKKHEGDDPYSLNVKPVWNSLPEYLDEYHEQLYTSLTTMVRPTTGLPLSMGYEGKSFKDVAEYVIDFFEKRVFENKRINLSVVTGYGNTSPEEAFCDSFAYFVMGNRWKNKIPEEMLGMFYYLIS